MSLTPFEAADYLAGIKPQPLSDIYRPEGVMLRALKRFRIAQGPSAPEPTLLITEDSLFSLDGDEPGVTLDGLIREGYAEVANLT